MRIHILICLCLFFAPGLSFAQVAPEIGYVHPAGGQPGTTLDVKIGGYDWTTDTQIFVHDPRVKLEVVGPPSGVLVPDPPYWFGNKARGNDRPLPREFPARLTIAADMPPGVLKFQVANANGASPPGFLHIGATPAIAEDAAHKRPHVLSRLPITVCGQIRTIEEIDRYEFTAAVDGPLTIELFARRLMSPLHGLLKVVDGNGQVVVDKADTEGRDLAVSFIAHAGMKYQVSLHDLDYAGDRSYVYQLAIAQRPRVLAAFPAAGKPGEAREIEFHGLGLATGANKIESLKRNVTFPAGPIFEYVLETPFGNAAPFALGLSNIAEHTKPDGTREMVLPSLPCAVTASIAQRFGTDRYTLSLVKDQKLNIAAQARSIGSPLDLELCLLDSTGKEITRNDDTPGTTDPTLLFAAPADGVYTLLVSDSSGSSGVRTAHYRLTIEAPIEDFSLIVPTQLSIPLGTAVKLPLKLVRQGGFKGAVHVTCAGLPAGVTSTADVKFAENVSDLPVDLTSQVDAAIAAGMVTVTATAQVGDRTITRTAPILIATNMKPRIKLTPEGLDDVRKVHRGSTFLGPVLIDRLEGFAGEIVLEMTAKQQRSRQGMTSDEFVVAPDAKRIEYPIFVPEWMETTKTSRMILNGAVKVPDPKGNVRTLLQRQELRIGVLPEGALMKLGHAGKEIHAKVGSEIEVPLALFRTADFREAVTLEVITQDVPNGVTAEPVVVMGDQQVGTMKLRIAADPHLVGEYKIKFRATALRDGKWPVISEANLLMIVEP